MTEWSTELWVFVLLLEMAVSGLLAGACRIFNARQAIDATTKRQSEEYEAALESARRDRLLLALLIRSRRWNPPSDGFLGEPPTWKRASRPRRGPNGRNGAAAVTLDDGESLEAIDVVGWTIH